MRRRQPLAANDAGVPAALFDYRHPAWASDRNAWAWCAEHGVPAGAVRAKTMVSGRERQRRRGGALGGWAEAHGYMSPRYPKNPDWHRLAALGLVPAGSPTGPRASRGA